MADEDNQECPPCLQHVPLWMVTFADMMSLLMAFFVLLSILNPTGNPDSAAAEEVMASIQQAFGQSEGGSTLSDGKLQNMGFNFNNLPSSSKSTKTNAQLLKKVQELFSNEMKSRKVNINETKDGFSITLMGDLYFASGMSELSKEAEPVLNKIGDLILDLQRSNIDNAIRIKGFADASLIKPNSIRFKNNLALTSARSASVIEYFWNFGVSPTRVYNGQTLSKFQSMGYGEFQPLESNVTPEERAYNRRVEIEFLNDPDAK